MMKEAFRVGFGFGLASGVITTLGLMIGLYSSTNSKMVVLGGILTIAIADAFSDATGIHFAEESEGVHTTREIWLATMCTFFSKFFVSSSFLIPVFLLPIRTGILVSIIYGTLLIGTFSYVIAKRQKKNAMHAILEHFSIMVAVIIVTFFVGEFSKRFFG